MTDVLRIVSVSGGKDSTALYLWAIEQWGKDGFLAIFANTGNEHPVTLNYVRNLAEMAKGPPITWVEASFTEKLRARGIEIPEEESAFLRMWLWKGRAPSSQAQFCTEETKLKPIAEWLETVRGDSEPIMYTGIRAGESERRSKMPEREYAKLYDCYTERPLLRWSEEQVFAMLEKHGVPANPLYSAGQARVGCYPCIHSRKEQLATMEDWAWEKLARWEKLAGRTFFGFGTVPLTQTQQLELSRLTDPSEISEWKNKNSPSVYEVREWSKTTRGGKQHALFPEPVQDVPSCMSTWGACE
jgi:3'-phosphoadenosine 5'-phosphosulfate sulfotransferase (PAPS reductase)/FAD synthetase